jgi:flagellar biosynthesis/type III secretory pathway ATPase
LLFLLVDIHTLVPRVPLMVSATLPSLQDRLADVPRLRPLGRVTRIVGLVMEATGLELGLGALCRVTSLSDDHSVLAEVVGFHERGALLMPLGDIEGMHPGASVADLGRNLGVRVGNALLGRVVNALGTPIDGSARSTSKAACRSRTIRPIRCSASGSTRRSSPACARSTAC